MLGWVTQLATTGARHEMQREQRKLRAWLPLQRLRLRADGVAAQEAGLEDHARVEVQRAGSASREPGPLEREIWKRLSNPLPDSHELKSWPQFFNPIITGDRRHELRRNDRDYRVGDSLVLREFDPSRGAYTGRSCTAVVTSITSRDEPCAVSVEGLSQDFCILTIRLACTPLISPAEYKQRWDDAEAHLDGKFK